MVAHSSLATIDVNDHILTTASIAIRTSSGQSFNLYVASSCISSGMRTWIYHLFTSKLEPGNTQTRYKQITDIVNLQDKNRQILPRLPRKSTYKTHPVIPRPNQCLHAQVNLSSVTRAYCETLAVLPSVGPASVVTGYGFQSRSASICQTDSRGGAKEKDSSRYKPGQAAVRTSVEAGRLQDA
ncbi:hypothetical protein LSAT2_010493 [Lamellibrachia satsuma]|nr:hypothetical protein LSAT2_010493 [Lamellibrachia satsuma]